MKDNNWPHLIFPHKQVIHFDNGEQRELYNITKIANGKWIHFICDDGHGGSEVIVNPSRILFVRIINEQTN